ncbi:phosphatase PAP2 family protein [Natronolimnohabitans innermongolicus]|uniref:Phosphoesterase PA-phosphatase-like protein n=1 Tax=Natronolimnohabitans innermongolicus JCM 12255 TaxID=1227499 RepID=L9WR85_9EURY|nr:phosphatase PAP2 family protein [Natronolimnohabitans innermongolicus]ELY51721.1 phosphoesterase PA-phosphatase-like protein [Natronolimnohabitans innermongolicus JCM 12255]
MTRGFGEVDLLQEFVPDALAFPVAMATQLGAIWFALVIIACVYRFHDREDAVVIGGLLVAGTGIWRTIKIVAPVPRPEQPLVALESLPTLLQPLFELAVVDSGAGFPSGHAVTTTVIYLSLARYLSVGTRLQRYLGAFSMVSLVGLTRITLGVHYLVDVVAGALIGNTLLLSAHWLAARAPDHRVSIALSLGVCSASICLLANLLVGPFGLWEVALFAGGVGGYVWWHFIAVDRRPIGFGEPS